MVEDEQSHRIVEYTVHGYHNSDPKKTHSSSPVDHVYLDQSSNHSWKYSRKTLGRGLALEGGRIALLRLGKVSRISRDQ